MRKYLVALMLLVGVGSTLLIASFATAGSGSSSIEAKDGLIGYQEVPALSTTGSGTFKAKVVDEDTVEWELSYGGMEGNVLQAHIHFAQRSVNGGISVFLCTNLGNAPAPPASPTAACPPSPATISGEFSANDVLNTVSGTTFQGIEPGAFGEFLAAIRAGKTYANVHTSKWPGGEIRGQLNDPNGKD
jgi:hypothetical protein